MRAVSSNPKKINGVNTYISPESTSKNKEAS